MEIKVYNLNQNNHIFYTIKNGDTVESVAKMFSVPKDYVLMHNKGELYQGKIIYLPEINFSSYVVEPFDTLDIVAKKTGQSVEDIKQKNNLQSNYIFVGQKLFV